MDSRSPVPTAHRVIVGVDGTAGSVEALRWAAHEAARRSWPLHVVTCAEVPVTLDAGLMGGIAGAPAVEGIVHDDEAVNERAVHAARSFALGVDVSGETVLGAPAYALSAMAQPHGLVVVGATSHPTRLTDVLGSVASIVAHRARGAIAVIHGAVPPSGDIHRIVVGVDGSRGSDAALQWATEQALRCGSELVLVHGWSYPYATARAGASEPRQEMKLDAMRTLEASAALVREVAPSVRCTSIISEDSPAKAVLDEVQDRGRGADLVVVGSRGHGGFASLLLGSVSRTVLQHATVPVVVVRCDD